MKVAMINGLICGIILGVVVSFWIGNIRLGIVISLSLIMIILLSGFNGAAVPLILKRINIDPALASGPFVTTSNDILSLFIYLGLVTLFLKLA
jgi:magnesium transporter